jgi:hypothetical protein
MRRTWLRPTWMPWAWAGGGKGVQRPLCRLVSLLGLVQAEGAVGLTAEPARWVAAGQRDDLAAVQLPEPPWPALAG